ncbi:MFS transporter, DHA1 family, multidrug resistance protein [Paenibacillus sp. UNCCL117]|uniref:MFS transporter n=1 Tax=unclassified Paenibacillus TaxID=185978 RepID=UPI000880CE71|nr:MULTISPECIES: MFS transporter [unclassified Paenibacillus]SDC43878.1 MFS transporter, DHA1 family, multidrug resistance protein [Paenibacillus sp. cl123]SFW12858.1 MFS transporter, DHA1 family, multidrug resistance protein [Paenibacillus sp. UNCCL117]
MHAWKRTFWILFAGVLLCSSSYTMAVPFLPLFLFELGVDADSVHLWSGIVYSSAFFMGALMAPLWGSLADKYGKKKMVVRAGISLAVIYGLIAAVQTPWQLIGVRLLHGFVGGFVPASMSIVASTAPEKQLGWSLGMMQAGTMTGGIMGPLVGGFLAEWFGLRMSFVVAAAIILAAAIAVIVWVKEGERAAAPEKSAKVGLTHTWKEAFKRPALLPLLLLLVVFQLSVNMIQPVLTLHIADIQGKLEGAVLTSGIIFSIIGLAGIVASPFWGKKGQVHEYSSIMCLCLLAAGSVVMLQFFVDRLWLFTTVQFVFGFFMAGVVPSVNTLVVRATDAEFRGRSFGLTTSANQLGAMIGPLIGGAVGLYWNVNGVFVITGMLLCLAGSAVYALPKLNASRSRHLQG